MQRFINWKYPDFDADGYTKYGWRCQHHKNLALGTNTDIGCFTYLNAKYGIEIGNDAQIGGGCKIYSEDSIDNTKGKVIIGKNACIGANSVVLPGAMIGENSIVGACSCVKRGQKIPPNELWVGVPAKKKCDL